MNVEGLEEEPVGHVRGRLGAFKVPKAVQPVAGLSRNASGEIIERELRDRPRGLPATGCFRPGSVPLRPPTRGFFRPNNGHDNCHSR
ncbi:hypothetical protein [Nocardiopsis protaetiae]|uniref:hypothetical protein n=1 Tax=Nocardiopsis protaetiae TaxID=3382270 RepID=UPI00387B3278